MNVLVAYGSRYGSTRETARVIAERLDTQGIEAEVLDAADVDSLAGYDLVVVGSGVYAGLLRRRVLRLLHRIARQHPELPVAVFAQGPLETEADKPEDWQWLRTRLANLLGKIDDLNVVSTAVFGGYLDPQRIRFMFGKGEVKDARDEHAVEAWADEVVQLVPVPAGAR